MQHILSLDDFERAAEKRLPRCIFAYVEGGTETNSARTANRRDFGLYDLVPRMFRDVGSRNLETSLLGEPYSAPFGIAPMGFCGLTSYRGDLVMARSGAKANIPVIVSATSLIPLEEIYAANPRAWFQAYLRGRLDAIDPMIDRVERAGYETLVITADVPVVGSRENNIRAGFTAPLRPSLRLAWDGITHPRWLTGVLARTLLTHGVPYFENGDHVRGSPVISPSAVRDFTGQDRLDWNHVRHIRARWRGKLVLKGLLASDDVKMARELGADAVIASNHGGRQLDYAVSAIAVLPQLLEAAGPMPVLIDGGFRRGTDVIKALALGAGFVFVGRPFNYAGAVGSDKGVAHAIALLREEIDRDMALMGCCTIAEIDQRFVRRRAG
jgi:L-lactate dehydrogenase (cytochrome)